LRWFGRVERRDDADGIKYWRQMELEKRGSPKKTWWDGVREDMERFGLSQKDALEWNGEEKSRGQATGVHLANG